MNGKEIEDYLLKNMPAEVRPGFPDGSGCHSLRSFHFSPWLQIKMKMAHFCEPLNYWLPGQGSNLDSSDPESDVLPITPPGNYLLQIYRSRILISITNSVLCFHYYFIKSYLHTIVFV